MSTLALSPAGRRYGAKRDVADARDWTLASAPIFRLRLNQVKPYGDYREWMGPIKDQGNEGSCTAHGWTSDKEWTARKYENREPILSPNFFYAKELLRESSFPNDEGAEPRTGAQVLNDTGACEESLYPYVDGKLTVPTPEQEENAAKYKQGAYHRINNSVDAISCLANETPWLFTVSFNVLQSFENNQTANTGVWLPDKHKESSFGGHLTLGGLAYDIGATPTLRPQNCPPAILIQNSWGKSWGLNGTVWFPLYLFDDPDIISDVWMAHNGRPWVPKN